MWRPLLVLVLIPLALGGCVRKDMQDLKEYVAEVKARPPTPIDPIPQLKQAETFLYVADDRRDPFVPTEEIADVLSPNIEEGPRPDPNRRKEELEFYPLDSLRMVGTLDKDGVRWALIRSPDGTIHRVKEGNYLGKNDGRIVAISEDRIDIVELIPNGSGGYIEREAQLILGDEET